jgi:hypothetical protein
LENADAKALIEKKVERIKAELEGLPTWIARGIVNEAVTEELYKFHNPKQERANELIEENLELQVQFMKKLLGPDAKTVLKAELDPEIYQQLFPGEEEEKEEEPDKEEDEDEKTDST